MTFFTLKLLNAFERYWNLYYFTKIPCNFLSRIMELLKNPSDLHTLSTKVSANEYKIFLKNYCVIHNKPIQINRQKFELYLQAIFAAVWIVYDFGGQILRMLSPVRQDFNANSKLAPIWRSIPAKVWRVPTNLSVLENKADLLRAFNVWLLRARVEYLIGQSVTSL